MNPVSQVQILKEIVCISHRVNIIGKTISPTILPQVMIKLYIKLDSLMFVWQLINKKESSEFTSVVNCPRRAAGVMLTEPNLVIPTQDRMHESCPHDQTRLFLPKTGYVSYAHLVIPAQDRLHESCSHDQTRLFLPKTGCMSHAHMIKLGYFCPRLAAWVMPTWSN